MSIDPRPTPPDREPASPFGWLPHGDAAFPAMLQAIAAARHCVRLETYIYTDSGIGREVRQALLAAAGRGLRTQVMIDALGSQSLPSGFWDPLNRAGGQIRWFNPLELRRLPTRNHRKLLVCDDREAFIGGFNIAPEYQGDGMARGWRDLGLRLQGPVVQALSRSFDELFERAGEKPKRFARIRRASHPPAIDAQPGCRLLLGVPGRGHSAIQSSLLHDLSRARDVRLIVPYFLPGARLRRSLQKVARRGGTVRLIVPGKTDVALSRLAAHSLYHRMFRAGVEIHEYLPQILHAKLFMIDGAVYVGSSNLDTRSLHLNYELLVRLEDAGIEREARSYFADTLARSRRVDPLKWGARRGFWTRLHERWAWFLLARADPWVARWLSQS